jgi:hypothetical protein
MKGGGQ